MEKEKEGGILFEELYMESKEILKLYPVIKKKFLSYTDFWKKGLDTIWLSSLNKLYFLDH